MSVNIKNIPEELHHLVNLVEKWGITDDGYRDDQIEKSSLSDLSLLVKSLDDATLDKLNHWLSNENEIKTFSKLQEYIDLAADYNIEIRFRPE